MNLDERYDPMDDLIGKVLAGEATAEENAEVERWLSENESNRGYFNQVKVIFEKAASNVVEQQFDTDAAWKKVQSKISRGENKSRIVISNWSPLRIAAGLLIFAFAGIFAYRWMTPEVQTLAIASTGVTVRDTLPDGSTAFLNKKSELSFVYDPSEKTRKVKLRGEAYFQVKHEEEKPFIIETDDVLIKDLGTAFNVNAYPESHTVEVIVESGEVQIYTLSDKGIGLRAGEKGIYDKTLREFSKIVKIDTNSLSYRTRVFSFNNTDLGSVVEMLNDVYNAKIKFANEALRDCHLTVNFNDEDLDTVIDILAETLNLKVTRNPDESGDEIILDGRGCN